MTPILVLSLPGILLFLVLCVCVCVDFLALEIFYSVFLLGLSVLLLGLDFKNSVQIFLFSRVVLALQVDTKANTLQYAD